ncbi:MAG: hypothetical protein LIO70_08440 [Clostridiales bacterium]|nr:hypothetical protein [Clostridiales bacterium]
MKKINERKVMGVFFKVYEEDNIDVEKTVNQLLENKIRIEEVYVFEDCDIGMQSIDCCYDINEFLKQYKKIMSYDLDTIEFRMTYNELPVELTMSFDNNLLLFTTPQKDVELDDLLNI